MIKVVFRNNDFFFV